MLDVRDRYSGLWAFLTTPLVSDRIHTLRFNRLVESALASRYRVLCVGGTIGDGGSLTPDELGELTRLAVTAATGSTPVVATIHHRRGTEESAIAAQEAGAALVLIVPCEGEPVDETVRAVSEAAVGLPIVLYNIGSLDLDVAKLSRILEVGPIVGLKDGSGDLRGFRRLREAFPDLVTIAAWEDLAPAYWALGCDAFAPASAAYAPWYAPLWYDALRRGDIVSTRAVLSAHAFPMSDLRRSRSGIGRAVISATSERLGLSLGTPRMPMSRLSETEEQRLESLLDGLAELRRSRVPDNLARHEEVES
jgi:dihydrodipicolinate synthase/N-acetylneuraminate lyase